MTIARHDHDHDLQQRHIQEGGAVHQLSGGAATTLTALLGGAAPTAPAVPCQEHPADLWFAELPAEVELAKSLCVTCPVREACLAGALDRREPWGVWGGQLVLQGVVVARKRPRGRPRKDEVAA